MRFSFYLISAALALVGCATPKIDSNAWTDQELSRIFNVSEVERGSLSGSSDYKEIDILPVKIGSSWPGEQRKAIAELKLRASAAGASAITDVGCITPDKNVAYSVCAAKGLIMPDAKNGREIDRRLITAARNGYMGPNLIGITNFVQGLRDGKYESRDMASAVIYFDGENDSRFVAVGDAGGWGAIYASPDFENKILVKDGREYIQGRRLSGSVYGFIAMRPIYLDGFHLGNFLYFEKIQ